MKIPRNEYRQPILKCPDCRKERAVLTYEENRGYKLHCPKCGYDHTFKHVSEAAAIEHCGMLLKIAEYEDCLRLIPASEIHEDDSTVLWWNVPIEEPPTVASILDCDMEERFGFDDDGNVTGFTHFSLIPKVWEGDVANV